MIPRRIFFFWGNHEMSWLRYMTLASCKAFHPDWEIVLYVPSVIVEDSVPYDHGEISDSTYDIETDYFDYVEELGIRIRVVDISDVDPSWNSRRLVHRSDIFRYHELHERGGFYCDMDMVFVRSLDVLLGEMNDGGLDCGMGRNVGAFHYSIGLLASRPGCSLYWEMLAMALSKVTENGYQSAGVAMMARRWPFWQDLTGHFDKLRILLLSTDLTCRIGSMDVPKIYEDSDIKVDPSSIGVHWFGGSTHSKEFNSIARPDKIPIVQDDCLSYIDRALNIAMTRACSTMDSRSFGAR